MNRRIVFIFFAVIAVMLPAVLSAQKQKPKNKSWYDDKLLHFGFSLGFNTMDFNITPSQTYLSADSLYPEVSILNPGINIQVITDLHPANHIDIRFLPGVSFGQRNVRYYKNNTLYNSGQRLESSFLEFPLLIKYKGDRLNNVRPYVVSGLNFRYDLAAKKEYDEEKPVFIRLKKPDLYYEVGAGLDFYLVYFKLSVEIKMSNGIFNVLVDEPASGHEEFRNAIDKMRSQMWVVAFHFE
ncbi:MAG TPA: porin family protein [Bacteroidales bacterium]|nr:porin family protein [Bacteroidales bacterium]